MIRQQHELPRKERVILHGQSSLLLLLGVYDIIFPPNVWIFGAGISWMRVKHSTTELHSQPYVHAS